MLRIISPPSPPANAAAQRRERRIFTQGMLTLATLALSGARAATTSNEAISHSAESIHQEPIFKAGRKRVYDALTIASQFDQVIKLTGVMQSPAMAAMQKPTEISRHVGGPFALFGGYIVGRHIELVPNELVVQAWRVGSWSPGVYSIVRFELTDESGGTKILFDHGAFPNGRAADLASGWKEHYWDPLEKFLS
jgi:activator of HSP90 ATPase